MLNSIKKIMFFLSLITVFAIGVLSASNTNNFFLTDQDFSAYFLNENLPVNYSLNLENGKERVDFALSSKHKFYSSLIELFQGKNPSTSFLSVNKKIKNNHLLLNFHLFTGLDFFSDKENKSYYFAYNGIKLNGSFNQNLKFNANFWKGHFTGNYEYAKKSSLLNSWYQSSDDHKKIYLDKVTAKIEFDSQFGVFAVGRGKFNLGNNIGGSIILSDVSNDYGYLSYQANFGEWYLNFLHASLIADSLSTFSDGKKFDEKNLVVHSIHRKNEKWHLFFGEEVIYGNRTIDFNYLLPQTIMRVTEHNLGDRDNIMIFFGYNWKLSKNIHHYFNFLFDELSKSKIFTDWWGNKYATQTGISITNILNKKNTDNLTFEFTAIRPWIYTHKFLVDKYSHDDNPLGFPDGANLIQYAMQYKLPFTKTINWINFVSYTRQGSVGNQFYINYESRPKDTATWLEGQITDKFKIKSVLGWNFLHRHNLRIGYQYLSEDNFATINEFSLSYKVFY